MASKKSANKKSGLGFALWLLAAIALLILFIVNQGRIFSNLKATGFFNRVFGKTPAFVENAEITNVDDTEKNDVEPFSSSIDVTPSAATASASGIIEQNQAALMEQETPSLPTDSASEDSAEPPKPSVSVSDIGKTMNIRLFFMTINSDGSVSRKEITRSMKKSDSPLVDAINALIEGPDSSEDAQGCRTLISNGTKLIRATVKDGVATLNFSEEFQFNQHGVEGLRGQLQQIVYTATAFPTVKSVQFLIDGEKREYLDSDGMLDVWIGTPLTRNSF